MRLLLALVLTVWMPLAAFAQSDGDDGPGYLASLLQGALSGAGRDVQIRGFAGALSSRATLDRLTISDRDGVWLIVENAALDWNRAALFRGAVDVNELTAARIEVVRAPIAEPTLPDPEAGGFRIPDLPVSVKIGRIATDDLVLGEALLGQAAVLGLEGSAELGDAVRVDFTAARSDGRRGRFAVELEYDRAAAFLTTRLDLSEEAGGIAATVLDLPDRPSVDLTLDGQGPVDGFAAQLALKTDGMPRLAGRVTLAGDGPGATAFDADIGGDITALLAPQTRAFFGPEVTLRVAGRNSQDAGLRVDRLSLSAAAVDLEGALSLDPQGRPVMVDLDGKIARGGELVDLPFGTDLRLRAAAIGARFDAAAGPDWTLTAQIDDLAVPGLDLPSLSVTGTGVLDLGETTRFDGALTLEAATDLTDPALARAVGSVVRLGTGIAWQTGGAIGLSGFELATETLTASGSARIDIVDKAVLVEGGASVEAGDLAAFGLLAGVDLSGRASAEIAGSADVLAGAFDLRVGAATDDLALGIAQVDPFLAGRTRFDASVARGAGGITLDKLTLSNPALDLSASGNLSSTAGDLRYDAVLREAARAAGGTGGDFRTSGRALFDGQVWRLDGSGEIAAAVLNQPQADTLLAQGASLGYTLRLDGGRTTLDAARLGNDLVALTASGEIAPALDLGAVLDMPRTGVLFDTDGGPARMTLGVDRAADGAVRLRLDGTVQDVALGVGPVDDLLRGTTRAEGLFMLKPDGVIEITQASLSGATLVANATGRFQDGDIDITAQGELANSGVLFGTNGGPARVVVNALSTEIGLRLAASAELVDLRTGIAQADAVLPGRTQAELVVVLTDSGEIRINRVRIDGVALNASARGLIRDDTVDLSFETALDNVGRVTDALSGQVRARGTVQGKVASPRIDIVAEGPGGAAIRAAGQLGLPGGAVDLNATGAVPLELLDSVMGSRSLAGQTRFELTLRGQPGPAAVNGRITLSDARFFDPELELEVSAIAGTVDLAGGRATLGIDGRVQDGRIGISGTIGLNPPFQSDLTVALGSVPIERRLLLSTRLSGDLRLSGGLTSANRVSGALVLDRTELRIPSSVGGAAEAIPDITHVNTPAAVRTSQARAGLLDQAGGSGAPSRTTLDLRISNGDPMFLRGRGIDAELGGTLQLTGSTDNVQAVGQFSLVRGRMTLLGQRLDFTEGRVTFAGSLEPRLFLEAQSQAPKHLIKILIQGAAASPEINFSATPDLPEDEVLAQLFFGRPVAELSAFQAARLAAGVAELAGDGSPGLMDKLRSGLGVDDLDVSVDDKGDTAVRAGKYIDDNIYTDVEVSSGGNTKVSINLDVGRNVVVKGSAGSDGATGIGVFFEKDY